MSPAAQEIIDTEVRLGTAKDTLKDRQKELQEILDGHQAYKTLKEAQRQLEVAKEGLKRALMNDEAYNNKLEEIHEANEDISALRSTISSMLVAYYASTKSREIEVSDTYSREVIVTGRLGKAHRTNLKLV